MRSRSTAARSKSSSAEAAAICFSSSVMKRRSWLDMKAMNWSTIARCSATVTFCEQGPPHRPICPGKHERPVCIARL